MAATSEEYADSVCSVSVRHALGRLPWRNRLYRAAEHDAGFHLHPLPVPLIGPELPLFQSIADGLLLFRKRTQKVDVFDLALLINDDAHRNRVIASHRE